MRLVSADLAWLIGDGVLYFSCVIYSAAGRNRWRQLRCPAQLEMLSYSDALLLFLELIQVEDHGRF